MDRELLQRYIEGCVTDREVETVVDWLDESQEHVREYKALHKLYDITLLNESKTALSGKINRKRVGLHPAIYECMKIAAVVLLVWSGTKILDYYQSKPNNAVTYQTVYVPAGQRAELTLPDRTKIWLHSKSKLIYPTNFGHGSRQVELNGEGFFCVTSDSTRPFIVKTDKIDIRVLGTEFNVIAYSGSESTEIDLLSGKVNFRIKEKSESYTLEPNRQAVYKKGELSFSPIPNQAYFKWREGIICFDNETIECIFGKLQLYYDVTIKTDRQPFLQERYSGKFRINDGIEQILKVLQIEHPFVYAKNNELNVVTIK